MDMQTRVGKILNEMAQIGTVAGYVVQVYGETEKNINKPSHFHINKDGKTVTRILIPAENKPDNVKDLTIFPGDPELNSKTIKKIISFLKEKSKISKYGSFKNNLVLIKFAWDFMNPDRKLD